METFTCPSCKKEMSVDYKRTVCLGYSREENCHVYGDECAYCAASDGHPWRYSLHETVITNPINGKDYNYFFEGYLDEWEEQQSSKPKEILAVAGETYEVDELLGKDTPPEGLLPCWNPDDEMLEKLVQYLLEN